MMPTAGGARRAPPTQETWPRWLGFNLWRFACVLIGVAAALVAISALFGANDGDDPPWAAWVAYLLYGATLRLPPLTPPASAATSR